MMGHLNNNSLRHKFEILQDVININLDILLLEIKLNDSGPSAQFLLKGYGIPYRFDRNSKGGRFLFYICEDIPSKFLEVESDNNNESTYVEIHLKEQK